MDDAGMLGGHGMMLACHMPFLLSGAAYTATAPGASQRA
jgi:hypothetical protein